MAHVNGVYYPEGSDPYDLPEDLKEHASTDAQQALDAAAAPRGGLQRVNAPVTEFLLDSSGGFQFHSGGSRVWRVDSNGVLQEGSIPGARIDDLHQLIRPDDLGWLLLDSNGGFQFLSNGTRVWRVDNTGTLVEGFVSDMKRADGAGQLTMTSNGQIMFLSNGVRVWRVDERGVLVEGYVSDMKRHDGAGQLTMTSNGEIMFLSNGERVWRVDATGTLVEGSVPGHLVTGGVGNGLPGQVSFWGPSTVEHMADELRTEFSDYGIAAHPLGSSGEWSAQTMTRIIPVTMTIEGGVIPETGPVRVTHPGLGMGEQPRLLREGTTGWLGGVHGTLIGYSITTRYEFQRTHPGPSVSAASALWVPEKQEPAQLNVWLDGCKNDIMGNGTSPAQYDRAIANRDAAVASWQAAGIDYLVVSGFINQGYGPTDVGRQNMDNESADAAAKYPGRHLNMQDLISTREVWDWTGITPTAADLTSQSIRELPDSLHGTGNHLNDLGNAFIAHKLSEFMVNTGRIGGGKMPFTAHESQQDTGWRDLSGMLANGWTGALYARRIGDIVEFRAEALSASAATSGSLFYPPSGFSFGTPVRVRTTLHTASAAPTFRRVYISNAVMAVSSYDPSDVLYGQFTATTTDPMPTTLPGSPA